jgi:hypothetical protein
MRTCVRMAERRGERLQTSAPPFESGYELGDTKVEQILGSPTPRVGRIGKAGVF